MKHEAEISALRKERDAAFARIELLKAFARRAAERAVNICGESMRDAAMASDITVSARKGLQRCAMILRRRRSVLIDDAVREMP